MFYNYNFMGIFGEFCPLMSRVKYMNEAKYMNGEKYMSEAKYMRKVKYMIKVKYIGKIKKLGQQYVDRVFLNQIIFYPPFSLL